MKAAALSLALACTGALAQAPQVQQKIAMVERILNQSPLAGRVLAGPSEPARQHIANARELLGHARLLVAAGQHEQAEPVIHGSLWEIGRARQLVPDPATREASERARATQREDRLMQEAAQRLSGQTLVYDRRFASPRQEFDFELERYRSFERLVPLALERLKPGAEAMARVGRFVAQARALLERGESAAASDVPAAIRHVTEGTDALRSALQAAGLAVPVTMGSER
ncbi:MAG: hypothetical protein HY854_02765 [Burkholderiales bacterium]|nr:hypothetical protein [Burkholderiales bacterium]